MIDVNSHYVYKRNDKINRMNLRETQSDRVHVRTYMREKWRSTGHYSALTCTVAV